MMTSGEASLKKSGSSKTLGNSNNNSTEKEDPKSKPSLGSFLSSDTTGKSLSKKSGSATVAGDRIVKKETEGEVYIRADGKKVRRVVKKTILKKSASSVGGNAASAAEDDSSPSAGAPNDSSPSDTKSAKNLDSFLDRASAGVAVRKSSGSATVAGSTPSRSTIKPLSASTGAATTDTLGEVYIRADGKKVRRVKKSVASSSSAATVSGGEAPNQDLAKLSSSSSSSLAGFLDSGSSGKSRLSGSATVAGDQMMQPNLLSPSADDAQQGEIVTRADGKKVRRVLRKAVPRTRSGRSVGSNKSGASAEDTGSKSMASSDHDAKSEASEGALSHKSELTKSTDLTEDDSKSKLSVPAPEKLQSSQSNLSDFLDNSNSSKSGMKKMSGSATVSGGFASSSTPKKDDANNMESEVYIRADGKKVRRVKKSVKSSAAGDLAGFLEKPAESTGAKPGRSSATVAGDTPTKASAAVGNVAEESEVYIRADGKKVRRVKKVVKSSDAATVVGGDTNRSSLSGFLASSTSSSDIARSKLKGSATVAGDMLVNKNEDGEVYIRADGKKVRRIKKTVVAKPDATVDNYMANGENKDVATSENGDAANDEDGKPPAKSSLSSFLGKEVGGSVRKTASGAATVTGVPTAAAKKPGTEESEIYIRADGKKVRRVKKSVASSSAGDLAGFLDKPGAVKPKVSGSATVAGDNPTKAKSQQQDEGEIYIRADGKKVRRVKKVVSKSAAPSGGDLAGFLDTNSGATKTKMGGAATVAGDQVVKQTAEGEIVIRADGKKVLRRKKPTSEQGADSGAVETEVYRRADGKLVRRVKRASSGKSAAGDLAGFLDKNDEKKPAAKGSSATVAGDRMNSRASLTDLLKPTKDADKTTDSRPATPQTAALSESSTHNKDNLNPTSLEKEEKQTKPKVVALTEAEEELASSYRKMKRMGLPDSAVRHKMYQDNIDPKIITAVLRDEWAVAPTPKPMPEDKGPKLKPVPATKLTEDEEIVASSYRKMKRLGLGDDVVRHKMVQDGVSDTIVSSVLEGEAVTEGGVHAIVVTDPELQKPAPSDDSQPREPLPEVVQHSSLDSASSDKLHSSNGLSDADEALASTYRKMKKMGLPSDVVRHKMTQDGVDERIVFAVLDDDNPSATPLKEIVGTKPRETPAPISEVVTSSSDSLPDDTEAIASKYRKMQRMGLPDDAVRHKMEQDEVNTKIFDLVFGRQSAPPVESTNSLPSAVSDEALPQTEPASPALPLEHGHDEDEVVARYMKMKKMGLPDDVVRHKMIQDGIDESIISSFFGSQGEGYPPTIPNPLSEVESEKASVSTPVTAPTSQLTDEEEELASKYRKMKKMGLPDDVVKHKMVQDGVDERIIEAVLSGLAPAPAPASAPVAEPAPAQAPAAPAPRPLQTIHVKDENPTAEPVQASSSRGDVLQSSPSERHLTAGSHHLNIKAANAVAYIVVVSDEPFPSGGTPMISEVASLEATVPEVPVEVTTAEAAISQGMVKPDEKFAVKVESEETDAGASDADGYSKMKAETRYMTLDELAKLSGESKTSLEQLVQTKKKRSNSVPRFVLQPLEKKQPENVYEVELPVGSVAVSGSPQTAPVAASQPLPNASAHNMKEVRDGQEVVDSDLAKAARAVSALGDGDVAALLSKLQRGDVEDLLEKLREAEKRQKKLEKQLAQAGVAIAEDIEYNEAKTKVEQIAKRMNEIGGSDVVNPDKEEQNRLREEYFKLEQEMERYNAALMFTEEYQAEQDRIEREWEEGNAKDNEEALKKLRRHMPVKIRHMSEADLTNTPTPNGKFLPKATAKKFKRTNVLQLIRINPDDIERMHPASIENMRVTGLTLTERRALYWHLRSLGPKWEKNKSEKMTERKWTWYQMMKNNFKENLAPYQRHIDQYGPPSNHSCPLIGKQCPIKGDKVVDYDGDYGYTDAAEYEVSEVRKSDADDPGAKAMQEALELAREKKANERADILKKHYNGKLLQVSKANGSCESMDDSMDKMENHTLKWFEAVITKGTSGSEDEKKKEVALFTDALNEFKLLVLDFCQRSGMQTSGKKKAGGDSDDIRSSVELGLSEDVYECSREFFSFIQTRMKDIDVKDTRVEKTIELLDNMLNELHGRNIATLEKLGIPRPERSRKLKKNADMKKEVEESLKPKEEETPAAEMGGGGMGLPPGAGRGGRGGLMDALKGRGGGEGRGDLLSALSGRGRGRGGGGRGDLLSAIAGKGRGGGGDGDGGGRGGLMAAIAGRGRGGGGDGGGGDGGGRGGLLAAIAGRGRGGGGDGGGGRGGLLAAIAARGGGGD